MLVERAEELLSICRIHEHMHLVSEYLFYIFAGLCAGHCEHRCGEGPDAPSRPSQPESSEEAPAVEEVEASAPQHLMGGSL